MAATTSPAEENACPMHRPSLSVPRFVPSILVLLCAVMLGVSCGARAQGPRDVRPCDLFATAQTPCVDAISTTRALFRDYHGPLYQITRDHDDATRDIGLTPDGYADAAAQDTFCKSSTCIISRLYDQTPRHNDLTPAPRGGYSHGPGPHGDDVPAVADALPMTIAGHPVYGIAVTPGTGYRNDSPSGTAAHGQPEGVYMVTSALHLNAKCCFDYGNAETNNLDNDKGHMDAINIMCHGTPCAPDAGLDMENGIYGHLAVPAGTPFVTDIGVCDGQHTFAIFQGNAQSGALTSSGTRPLRPGYAPMQQEGAIILGIGGDNSNSATGYFFEGVMTQGQPTPETLGKLQANIVAARYAGHLQP